MKLDDLFLWFSSLIGGLVICGARLGFFLFRIAPEPPDDPEAYKMWRMKRRWLIYAEFSALPAFATISVVVGKMRDWGIWSIVFFSMVLGALGFAFFLDALQTIIRKKYGIGGDGNV